MKCANCGEQITDSYASVIIDQNGATQIWCGDCAEMCAWTCSVCFEPFSYDIKHTAETEDGYICKECLKLYKGGVTNENIQSICNA